jgi:2-polyprenyl-3-methyl-5-hydroxy-6-metoxy-1,4-benzoquinol methylase
MYELDTLWQEFYRRMAQKADAMKDPETGMVRSSFVKVVPCPYCRASDSDIRAIVHGFTYVTCRKCGLVYINPQLTNDALRDAYNDDDVRLFFFQELLLPYGEKSQRPEYMHRARALKVLCKQDRPRLLDIGCAAGNFLEIAGELGFDGEGLELNTHYVEYIKQNRSIKVFDKRLEEMNYPESVFDVVTLWDVLEHLPQPFEILREIVRILKPGGVLALTTINHHCINENFLGSRWRYYQPPDHLCSFTPNLLRAMIREAGCSVLTLEHHYMFEVLVDAVAGIRRTPDRKTAASFPVTKAKKVMYIALARGLELIFNTIRSGDLLTLYARKL